MAPVEYIAGWKCYNMNPQKFERLINNFFGSSCLEMDVFDQSGKRHTPRKWFITPISVMEQAVELIISGGILKFRYDSLAFAGVLHLQTHCHGWWRPCWHGR